MYRNNLKRKIDIILSVTAILFLLPVYAFIAILVKVKIGSPILFCQKRPGKSEKIFMLYKFRTMTNERDKNGVLLPDAERLTKFGKWLRETSLDELPELFNILKGDMSIVGPRPLLVSYLERYNREQHHRHDVRPGLTGLAQIKGRNGITWKKKFKYDLWYVKNVSPLLDFIIIIETIKKVLEKDGINQEGAVTMEEFHASQSYNFENRN